MPSIGTFQIFGIGQLAKLQLTPGIRQEASADDPKLTLAGRQ